MHDHARTSKMPEMRTAYQMERVIKFSLPKRSSKQLQSAAHHEHPKSSPPAVMRELHHDQEYGHNPDQPIPRLVQERAYSQVEGGVKSIIAARAKHQAKIGAISWAQPI